LYRSSLPKKPSDPVGGFPAAQASRTVGQFSFDRDVDAGDPFRVGQQQRFEVERLEQGEAARG